jgi:hypothetical protein
MGPRSPQDDERERARWAGTDEQGGPPCSETPRDVVAALVEAYRQAAQDALHAAWGESWPAWAAQEAAALRALHARCAGWLARFAAAAEREREGVGGQRCPVSSSPASRSRAGAGATQVADGGEHRDGDDV